MIVRNGAGWFYATRVFVLRNWMAIPIIILIEYLVSNRDLLNSALTANVFKHEAVAMIGTVIGIFLGFRFNEAYERWWEARKLWGQLVNSSRKWGRQITTLMTNDRVGGSRSPAELELARHVLVRRHLAYVNALRMRLRGETYDESVSSFLEPGEYDELSGAANLPTQLVKRHAEDLAAIFGNATADHVILARLDATLNEFCDVQGGCERIATTVFPESVTYVARILLWGVVLLIPIAFIDPDSVRYPIEFVTIFFICLSFLVVNQLAGMLQDPFENGPNDTPMTSICRTIEIDLLELLGETNLPEPTEPVKGILM